MHSMKVIVLSLLLTLATLHCGNEGLVVHVEGLKPDIVSLRVRFLRADQSIASENMISRTLNQFVVTDVENGDFTLAIAGFGAERCTVSEGSTAVGYRRGTLRPTDVTVTMTERPTQSCEVSVKVTAGVTAKSAPPGIDCAGGDAGKLCKADFPRGSRLDLTAAHAASYQSFASWTAGGCTGPGPCSITVTGPSQLEAGASPRICNKDGWCWMNPLPQGNTLRAIWGSAANDVWAVGDNGTILHYDGMTWINVDVGEKIDLYSICATDKDNIWIVSGSGSVLEYRKGKWEPAKTVRSGYELWSCHAVNNNNVFATSSDSVVNRFNGSTWSVAASSLFAERAGVSALWINQKYEGWLFDRGGRGATLKDDKWTATGASLGFPVYAMAGWQDSPLWAVGGGASMWSVDKWQATALPQGSGQLRAVWPLSANAAWAVGTEGTILAWNGSAWKKVPNPSKLGLNGVWGSSESDVWAVGDRGTLLHWDGSRWSSLWHDHANGNNLNKIWGSSPADVRAVGDKGTVLRWDGQQVQPEATESITDLTAIAGSSATDVWIAGIAGFVAQREGNRWKAIANSGGADIYSIFLDAPQNGWFGGEGRICSIRGGLISSIGCPRLEPSAGSVQAIWSALGTTWAGGYGLFSLSGGTWQPVVLPMMFPSLRITGGWFDGMDTMWMSSDNTSAAGVVTFNRAGVWSVSLENKTGAYYCSSIWGRSARDIWAACRSGAQLSHFNGATWRPIATPLTRGIIRSLWGSGESMWAAGDAGVLFHQAAPK